MKYDYLVVGAGLYGAVFAHEAMQKGKKVLVVDKRPHIAGNIYTEDVDGIDVHRYGAHIFHTSDRRVWEYVNRFAEFNNYINSPIARYHDELYNLPFNMNTFSKMWGIATPDEAKKIIRDQIADLNITEPKALIGFAGRRVIENTIHQKLPDDFQSAEYLESHGFIDRIVERKDLKAFIAKMLWYWGF